MYFKILPQIFYLHRSTMIPLPPIFSTLISASNNRPFPMSAKKNQANFATPPSCTPSLFEGNASIQRLKNTGTSPLTRSQSILSQSIVWYGEWKEIVRFHCQQFNALDSFITSLHDGNLHNQDWVQGPGTRKAVTQKFMTCIDITRIL